MPKMTSTHSALWQDRRARIWLTKPRPRVLICLHGLKRIKCETLAPRQKTSTRIGRGEREERTQRLLIGHIPFSTLKEGQHRVEGILDVATYEVGTETTIDGPRDYHGRLLDGSATVVSQWWTSQQDSARRDEAATVLTGSSTARSSRVRCQRSSLYNKNSSK